MMVMTKTVSLNMEAYEKLTKAKREGESYSETIIRLLSTPRMDDLLEFFGKFKDELTEEELDEFIKEARNAWN
ncbi:MAG: antitoxin VapB family protein [Candidatus Hodarchaeales archaeon]